MRSLAAHHRRQPEDAGPCALAAEATDLGVGALRPLVMRMLDDEGMQPETTSNRLPGHAEQITSQSGVVPVPLGPGAADSKPASRCAASGQANSVVPLP
jgi:hypothetical protein